MDLKGKRLLFLGGPMQVVKAVKQAKRMGVYTIVTDIKDDAVAKAVADESLPFGVTDIDGIITWCKQYPVDGVINFGVDPAQKSNILICEALGLPHVGTLEQVEYLSNKEAFKKLCQECDVDVIQSYKEEEITEAFGDYPILIKPAQNCGSRGSSVCFNKLEADNALKKAKDASTNGKVIIEKYMGGYLDFAAEYYAVNGDIFLVKAGDRILGEIKDNLDRQAVASVSPSKFTDTYIEKVNPKVVAMLQKIGIKEGALFIQGFVDGETVRFYDPAYRFPGTTYENSLWTATNINLMEYAVSFALGKKLEATPMFPVAYKLNGKCAISLYLTAHPGIIAEFSGLDAVRKLPGVITVSAKSHVSDIVPDSGDVNQRVAEIGLLVDDDKKTIENTIIQVQSLIKVLDENGDNLLVSQVNPFTLR